jgi:hypothetical protein
MEKEIISTEKAISCSGHLTRAYFAIINSDCFLVANLGANKDLWWYNCQGRVKESVPRSIRSSCLWVFDLFLAGRHIIFVAQLGR